MIILKYNKKNHKQIIHSAVTALRAGKVVVYPTETSYGLACDPKSAIGLKKFYAIKQRSRNQPVHVIVTSTAQAKKLVVWNTVANKLVKQFWPGSLSIILPLRSGAKFARLFSAQTGTLGLRMPRHVIPADLVKSLGRPIPATSANPSGKLLAGYDSYSAQNVIDQFINQKYQPDIIIDAGTLPKRKPSTLAKIEDDIITILRPGPITLKQIAKTLTT